MSNQDAAPLFPTSRCPQCEQMIPDSNLMIHRLAHERGQLNITSEAVCSPVLRSGTARTISLTDTEADPMDVEPIEIDSDSSDGPVGVARMPSRSRVIDITDDSDDDSIPAPSGIRRRRGRASNSQLRPATPSDVITIDNDPSSALDEDSTKWPCPRCTLLNHQNATSCAACQYQHVRPADPTRRERLVDPLPPPQETATSSPVLNGALLGTLLFGAGALVTGNSVANGMFEGAVTGAVGGAMMDSVLSSSPQSESPVRRGTSRGRRSQRRREQPRRVPDPLEENPRVTRTGPRPRPRSSVRVVRSNGRTIVTATNRRGSASVQRPGYEDPLMALMLGLASAEGALGGRATGARNVDGMSYEELLSRFGDGSENMGASEDVIAALPSTMIEDVEKELPQGARECLVCLEEFKRGDNRKTLPCLHGFHEGCINKWLQQNGSCPICKHKVSPA